MSVFETASSEEQADSGMLPKIALVALLFVMFGFVMFRVILPGDEPPVVADDLRTYYYPTYLSTYQQLASGSLPLWNPYQLAGVPRLGAIQGGTFYPLHFVYLFMTTSAGLAISLLLHLAILVVSIYVFARRLGLYWYSAIFAGLLVGMRGHYMKMLHFPNLVEASVWVVPGSVALLALSRGEFKRPVALVAICAAMSILAGYPQGTVYVGYFWGAFLLGLLAIHREPPRVWAIALLGLGAAVVLGSLIASIQLFPAFELSELGNRKIERLTLSQMYPMGIRSNNFWHTLMNHYHPAGDHRAPAFYFGAVGLALLPAGLFDARRRRLNILLCVLGILVLIATLGPVSPIFSFYRELPLLDSFRLPRRSRFLADICFAIAAAGGLDAVVRAIRGRAGEAREFAEHGVGRFLANAPLYVPLALLPVFMWVLAEERGDGVVVSAVLGLFLLLALRWARTGSGLAIFGVAVVLLAACEIAIRPPTRYQVAYAHAEAVDVYSRPSALFDRLRKSPQRVLIQGGQRMPEKVASTQRIRGLADYEPATTRRHAQYFNYLNTGRIAEAYPLTAFSGRLSLAGKSADPDALLKRYRLLELAGMGYVLTAKGSEFSPKLTEFLDRRNYNLVAHEDGNKLWKRELSMSRAYVVYHLERAPLPRALMGKISREKYRPLRLTYVEASADELIKGSTPLMLGIHKSLKGAPAEIVRDEPNDVVIRAELDVPGMVVLGDTYYPGWVATVDGQEVPIYAVNLLFRGVAVPAGSHEIAYRYRPRSVLYGFGVSLISIGVCAWMLISSGRKGPGLRG